MFDITKKVRHWHEDDISRALTFRSISPKAYRHVSEKNKLPYSSENTSNRWVAKLNVEPGVQQPVLHVLKHKAASMALDKRLCVLSFDKASVAYEWTYDKASDTLYAPKNRVQCAMIRGLSGAWKQLVFYDFDVAMSKDILFSIIVNVEAAGFLVVATVSDLGPNNLRL